MGSGPAHAVGPEVMVLGVAQDAGYPQAGTREHPAWEDHKLRRKAACIAVIDGQSGRRWLFEATPDFKDQLYLLDRAAPTSRRPGLDGIFLTHGHIGHYAGLIHLGREAMGAKGVPVFAMPRMKAFLEKNGPWELLVRLGNIKLIGITANRPIALGPRLRVTPLLVPHRDEYTETVGYEIQGPRKRVLFIPDVDKWEKLDRTKVRVETLIRRVDVAFLDGTFFADGEIPGRAMSEIPHPFISETMLRLGKLPVETRSKVHFIHLNRTNPAIDPRSDAAKRIRTAGFKLARPLQRVPL